MSHQRAGGELACVRTFGVKRRYRVVGRRGGGRVALQGVSLRVMPGEWVTLLGPNGSGKSTLLRLLVGADRPDEGAISVLGATPGGGERWRAAAAQLGIVFQSPGLDKLLTIRENLALQGVLVGLSGARLRERVGRVTELLGIADRLDDRVGVLSGGLARRADLARALLGEPSLLILDEPTTGLDLAARRAFWAVIREARRGAAILVSTHLMEEAELGDLAVLMHKGQIAAVGSPAQLRGGAMVLRCADAQGARSVLAPLGVSCDLAGIEGVRVEGMDSEMLVRAASELARAGIEFSIGPRTLGDAYLSVTGVDLSQGGGGGPS